IVAYGSSFETTAIAVYDKNGNVATEQVLTQWPVTYVYDGHDRIKRTVGPGAMGKLLYQSVVYPQPQPLQPDAVKQVVSQSGEMVGAHPLPLRETITELDEWDRPFRTKRLAMSSSNEYLLD